MRIFAIVAVVLAMTMSGIKYLIIFIITNNILRLTKIYIVKYSSRISSFISISATSLKCYDGIGTSYTEVTCPPTLGDYCAKISHGSKVARSCMNQELIAEMKNAPKANECTNERQADAYFCLCNDKDLCNAGSFKKISTLSILTMIVVFPLMKFLLF